MMLVSLSLQILKATVSLSTVFKELILFYFPEICFFCLFTDLGNCICGENSILLSQ